MKLPLPPSKTSWAQVFADLSPAKQKALLTWLGKDVDPTFLLKSWEFIARREQLPPEGAWIVWLLCAGRGFGKTRSGAEWLLDQHLNPPEDSNAPTGIIAATTEDLKRYCLRGPSGILSIAPEDFYPKYEAHNARLVWPNGTETLVFSSEKPERIRGPNLRGAWCDELASWSYLQECWDNLEFSLRATQHPRLVITTTPKPKKLLRQIIKHPQTVLSTGSTFENKSNLAPSFLKRMKELYDGTTVGKQELYAEILDEAKGALWRRAMFQYATPPEDLTRIVIAIDPAASNTEESAETGIVVGGKKEARAFVLEDLSGNYSPDGWARKAILAYHRLQADCIVAEKNNGGDMVQSTIQMTAREMHRQGEVPSSYVKIKLVWASRGKMARAEPVAALYEQGNVYHAQAFSELENQQCSWEPDSGQKSPDRLDASVWLLTELVISGREPLNSGYTPEIMGQLLMSTALGAPEDIQGGFLH